MREEIADSYGMLADLMELGGDGIHLPQGAVALPGCITEYVGESVALSVINRIHGISEADWKPIRVGGRKSMDYQLASDGHHLIRVEAKGTIAVEVNRKSDAVYSEKHRVVVQKSGPEREAHRVLSYGAITVILSEPRLLQCWLLDPIADDFGRSPRDVQSLARVGFLLWVIRLVSPRSRLATLLGARLIALEAMLDPHELDNVPLIEAEEGAAPEFTARFFSPLISQQRPHPFFSNRSYVVGGPAGGIVVVSRGRGSFFFIGFREDLLDLAESQDFDRIKSYAAAVASIFKRVRCTLPNREFENLDIDTGRLPEFEERGGYVRFELSGLLHYSAEGLVFGELPIPDDPGLRRSVSPPTGV